MLNNTIEKYLLREILITWVAVTLVLLVIMFGNVLAGSLGRASEGNLSADLVFVFVAVKSAGLLVTLIPLGLYLGILLALGRLYRDSEMTALFACGVGYKSVFKPAILAGLLGLVLISALTVWVNPLAAQYEQRLKAGIQDISALAFLAPGKFVESPDGSSVIFMQDGNEKKTRFDSVFLHREANNGERQVEVAQTAYYQKNQTTGDEFMVFSNGQTTTGSPGSASYIETRFKSHGILIPKVNHSEPRLRAAGMNMKQLWLSTNNAEKAELQWRLSIPLASLILAVLAVPISHTSPRQGRFAKIAIAILIYIPYSNLLVLARKWIADGTVNPIFGMWWVHLLVVLLLSIFVVHRLGYSWIRQIILPNKLQST